MAGALANIGSTGSTSSSASPMTLTYTLTATWGAFGFMRCASTGGVTSSTLGDGTNSYTALGLDVYDGGTGGSRLWYCPNVSAVAGATLSAAWSATTSFRGLGFVAYSGLGTGAALDNARQAQSAGGGPGTGTDAVTSTATGTVTQPNMFFGVAQSGQALSAGTGYTNDGTFTSMNSGAGITSRVESKNTSSTTGQAATFTLASNDITHAHVGAVAQAGGGGATRPVKMAGEWGGYAGESGGFAGKEALLHEGLYLPWDGLHVPPQVFQLMAEVQRGIFR